MFMCAERNTELHSSRCTRLRWLVFCSFAISLELRLQRTHRVAFRCDLRVQFACCIVLRLLFFCFAFYCNRTYAVILLAAATAAAAVVLIVDSVFGSTSFVWSLHSTQSTAAQWLEQSYGGLMECVQHWAQNPICLPKMIDMLDYAHVIAFGHMNT